MRQVIIWDKEPRRRCDDKIYINLYKEKLTPPYLASGNRTSIKCQLPIEAKENGVNITYLDLFFDCFRDEYGKNKHIYGLLFV